MAVPLPPPPPSLLANALTTLSLPALSLAFGLPLLAFSRSNTVTCNDGGGQGGGEGHVDDGGDDEHVNGRVRVPRLADTGNGRRWRSRRDSDNNDDVEEGGSHPPTPRTTATR